MVADISREGDITVPTLRLSSWSRRHDARRRLPYNACKPPRSGVGCAVRSAWFRDRILWRLCRDCAANHHARRSALTRSSVPIPRCWLATACGTGHSCIGAESAVHHTVRPGKPAPPTTDRQRLTPEPRLNRTRGRSRCQPDRVKVTAISAGWDGVWIYHIKDPSAKAYTTERP
jgi:hypothetical protein